MSTASTQVNPIIHWHCYARGIPSSMFVHMFIRPKFLIYDHNISKRQQTDWVQTTKNRLSTPLQGHGAHMRKLHWTKRTAKSVVESTSHKKIIPYTPPSKSWWTALIMDSPIVLYVHGAPYTPRHCCGLGSWRCAAKQYVNDMRSPTRSALVFAYKGGLGGKRCRE